MSTNNVSRLPTLAEVVSSKTRSPVDLFGFYIYMRDDQRSVDYLDLWLDIKQHTSLCRVYVRELRRSVLVATPDFEKEDQGRGLTPDNDPYTSYYSDDPEKHHSQYSDRPPHAGGGHIGDHNISPFLRSQSQLGIRDAGAKTPPPLHNYPTPHDSPESNASSRNKTRTINRADLRSAAEKILYTYLLPGSERECTLPREMVLDVQHAIEKDMRDDPEVFDAIREYIFQAMERDAFPGFLRAKALGNLVRFSALLRMLVGLLSLFAGFWTGFTLIFLGYSRVTRCWVILPFTIGVYLLFTHQYNLDPIIALVGYSECTFMSFRHIDEPYVRKLLNRRSWIVLLITTIVTAALCLLFILVPSRRL